MQQIRRNHTKSTSLLVYEDVIHVTTDVHSELHRSAPLLGHSRQFIDPTVYSTPLDAGRSRYLVTRITVLSTYVVHNKQATRMEAVLPQNDSETTVQAGIGSPGRRARAATESRPHEALASNCDRAHVARFRCFGTTQGLS